MELNISDNRPSTADQQYYLRRQVIEQAEFKIDGEDFESLYAAQHWVKEKGYDCGSSSYPYPTAIMKGDYDSYDLPWKWKNFKPAQKKTVHGVMVGDARNGPVTVYIFQ